jgi:hypothetical protein
VKWAVLALFVLTGATSAQDVQVKPGETAELQITLEPLPAPPAKILEVTVLPWGEVAMSAKTDPTAQATFGGSLRFDGIIPFREGRPDAWRFRVDINVASNASSEAQFSIADVKTWGRYGEVSLSTYAVVREANKATLSAYAEWGFQTALGSRLQIADRFFRHYEAGPRLAHGNSEVILAVTRDERLWGKWGWHIHGRAPVPGVGRVIYLLGDAILGIGSKSAGGDQLLLRIGVDIGEALGAVKKP